MTKQLMTGVATAALMFGASFAYAQEADEPETEVEEAGEAVEDEMDEAGEDLEEAGEETAEFAGNAAEETGEAAENAWDETKETARAAGEETEEAAEATGEAAENAWDETKETARAAGEETEEAAEATGEAAEDAWDETEETASAAGEETEEAAEEVAEETGEGVEEAGEELEDAGDDTREASADMAGDVEDAAENAGAQAERTAKNMSKGAKDVGDEIAQRAGVDEEPAAELIAYGCDDMQTADCDAIRSFVETTSFPIIRVGGKAFLTNAGLRGTEITGAPVRGAGGKKVGTISDVVLGDNGEIERVIVSSGGLFGLGDKLTAHPTDTVTIARDEDGEIVVDADGSLKDLKGMPAVKAEDEAEGVGRLATNLINSEVALTGSDDESARVEDVIMSGDGETAAVVLAVGEVLGMGGDRFLVDYDAVQVEQGAGGGLAVDMTLEEARNAEPFYYDIAVAKDKK